MRHLLKSGALQLALAALLITPAYAQGPTYDLILSQGTVYDGSGKLPVITDIGITGQRITGIGDLSEADTDNRVSVRGYAVSPGFINMLSWASEALLIDGRSQSDIRQGVTLEIFGEGRSMGPLSPSMRDAMRARQTEARFDIPWTTLGEYLEHLVAKGVSPNVGSFVGATTVRIHELGYANREPTPTELSRMQKLVSHAMQEGAFGVGSSLIYAPAFYADTDELVALMQAAARHNGAYISHLRSEGNQIEASIDELIEIARRTDAPAQIYHLKIAGKKNWPKYERVIAKIESARSAGIDVSTNMYTYTAGSTGLDAAMPPWSQEGGYAAWAERLQDPDLRPKIAKEMAVDANDWENLLLAAGPANTLLVGFRNPELRVFTGKTLAEVAQFLGKSPIETAIDLVIQDGSRVQVVYFLMSEDHVKRNIALPWMSFGSDAGSYTNAGVFLNRSTHPRAYGNFARLLGKYVRDEKVIPLTEAIHKLTELPAKFLHLADRGKLAVGHFADIAIFDPANIRDVATYEDPHQYAQGMVHVLVNGEWVLHNGAHTGALPGQVVRGPGWVVAP
ncbi:MAG: D-aminoacylase [Pseudomonadota bacterium]